MTSIESYSLPGILIVAVGALWFLLQKQMREHKEEREESERLHRIERDELRKTIEKQFEDSNRITNNATNALTELSTLIKSNRK